MSFMSETAYEYIFSDQTIDWANKIDIPVPTDVKTVFLDFMPGGILQTGAENPVYLRANGVTTGSYCNARKYHNGTSYTSSTSVFDTYMQVFISQASGVSFGCSQVTLHTRNGSKGGDGIPYGQVIYHGSTSIYPLETRLIRFLDSVNTISTINLYTANSTDVSFRCKVRFSR